jgi:DNA-binding transcriptional ArsR family regulator
MTSVGLFDPARLGLPQSQSWSPPPRKMPRHRRGDLFLKGPVPWNWLKAAARLPGSALAVGILAWHLVGFQKNGPVRITAAKASELGVSPRAVRRGLAALEKSGLVKVDRHRGRGPDVTVLAAPECAPSEIVA